jgi:hypothetical protein
VTKEVRHQILHHVPHIAGVTVQVEPPGEVDEASSVEARAHDGLPLQSRGSARPGLARGTPSVTAGLRIAHLPRSAEYRSSSIEYLPGAGTTHNSRVADAPRLGTLVHRAFRSLPHELAESGDHHVDPECPRGLYLLCAEADCCRPAECSLVRSG